MKLFAIHDNGLHYSFPYSGVENATPASRINSPYFNVSSYVVSVLLVVSFNTIISGIEVFGISIGNIASLLAFIVISAYAFTAILVHKVAEQQVGAWLISAGIIGTLYCIVWIANADPGFKSQILAISMLGITPLAWLVAKESREDEVIINDFIIVVVFLAGTSILLWVLGPILGLIQPNVSIGSDWASSSGIPLATDGYFYLLFCPQTIAKFGLLITRNTGIFYEAPMYSFVLCLALIGEVFGKKHTPRAWVVIILTASLITTFSTTGYLVGGATLIWMAAGRRPHNQRDKAGLTAPRLACYAIIGFLVFFAIKLLHEKLGTVSGSVRLDDFKAGFQAWLTSPVVGHGISCAQAANDFKDAVRQQGGLAMSNSLGDVLSRGGILFLLIFVGGFVGFWKSDSRKMRIAGIVFAVMWTFTIVTFESLVMAVLGLGYAELINSLQKNEMRRMRKNSLNSQSIMEYAQESAPRMIIKFILIPVLGAAIIWVMSPFFPKRYEAQSKVVLYSVSNSTDGDAVSLADDDLVQNVSKILVNYDQFHRTAVSLGISIAEDYYISSSAETNSTILMTCTASSPESASAFLSELVRTGRQADYLSDSNLILGNESKISISQVQPNNVLCSGAVFCSLLFINMGILLSNTSERKPFSLG